MKLTKLKNTLPGVLDLAPLKDDLGRNLAFRGNETKELPSTMLEEPLLKRVMDLKWLVEAPAVATPPAAKASAPPVIKTSAPPEDLKMPAMPEEREPQPTLVSTAPEPAPEAVSTLAEGTKPSELPFDVPTVSEAPVASEPAKESPPTPPSRSGKSSKSR